MHDDTAPRGKNLTQRVVAALSDRIGQGTLKPGDRMPAEPELIREFGVSRTVIREALQRLQARGLIETQHGVGSFVLAPAATAALLSLDERQLKLRDLLAMLELRVCVEVEAAALAAQRRRSEHLDGMSQALGGFEAHMQAQASTAEDDFAFHRHIANATGNPFFEQVLSTLGTATVVHHQAETGPDADNPPFTHTFPALGQRKELALREHQAIFEAIRQGDAAAARAAMFMHLNNSRERLKRLRDAA